MRPFSPQIALAALLLLPVVARAADADDIRQTLKTMAQEVTDGKLLAALDHYYTLNDDELDMAKASVELDAATAKFEAAIRAKFGDSGWSAVGSTVHALPKGGYDAVTINIDGAVATVTWPGEPNPMFLHKVVGGWKVSIPDIMAWGMKQAGATEAQMRDLEPQLLEISADRIRRNVSGIGWLALDVAAGKYASAAAAKTAAAAVMKGKKQ